MRVRRVVTGHTDTGKATVMIDEISTDLVTFRPGANVCNVWSTPSLPADNNDATDGAKTVAGTTRKGGSVFRLIEFLPGVAPRNHRTLSIDYAIVLEGEIDMTLDDELVHLKAGDVLVQRGTIHEWINNSGKPCVIAFILIDALPVTVAGRTLEATG